MARSGDIIAKHGWRILSQENSSRGDDLPGRLLALAGHDFAMFGSDLIHQPHGFLDIFCQNEPSVGVERALDQLAPVQSRQLAVDLPLHLSHEFG